MIIFPVKYGISKRLPIGEVQKRIIFLLENGFVRLGISKKYKGWVNASGFKLRPSGWDDPFLPIIIGKFKENSGVTIVRITFRQSYINIIFSLVGIAPSIFFLINLFFEPSFKLKVFAYAIFPVLILLVYFFNMKFRSNCNIEKRVIKIILAK